MAFNLYTLEGVGEPYDRRDRSYCEYEQRPIYDSENKGGRYMNDENKTYNDEKDLRCNQHSCNKTESVLKYVLVFVAGMFGGQVVKKVFKD